MIKLGIFDSGIGGLTVFKSVRREVPSASILYFGDTARVPYGTKSAKTVTRYSLQIADYLISREVDAIIVACNTASAYGLRVLENSLDIPVFGVVAPGARAAVGATKKGVVGVIGTRGTISSGAYQEAILGLDPDVKVVVAPCPLFVPLVEEGLLEDEVTVEIARRYLDPIIEQEVDTLVLGCTHYPMLKGVLSRVMGEGVVLIDSANETSIEVRASLAAKVEKMETGPGSVQFEVSDSPELFAKVGKIFLDYELEDVKMVNLLEGD